MKSKKYPIGIVGGIAVLLIAIGIRQYFKKDIHPFPLAAGEVIVNWQFTGPYKDGGENEAHIHSEIKRLTGLLKSGEFTKYELYVSIANQYELLGDGEQEYIYLGKALAIDSEKTGLAWYNMGRLLERLGAYESALQAYTNAAIAQPAPQYEDARDEFMTRYASLKEDNISL